MKSNWSLFYKFAGDTPREFYEVRQIGASVWTARGKVKTMGESSSTAFTNVVAAKAAYSEKCCQIVSEGFSLTREATYDWKGLAKTDAMIYYFSIMEVSNENNYQAGIYRRVSSGGG